jgi:Holliday junction DNA helicase RuvA
MNLGYPRPAAQKAVETAISQANKAGGINIMMDFEWVFRAAMAAVR